MSDPRRRKKASDITEGTQPMPDEEVLIAQALATKDRPWHDWGFKRLAKEWVVYEIVSYVKSKIESGSVNVTDKQEEIFIKLVQEYDEDIAKEINGKLVEREFTASEVKQATEGKISWAGADRVGGMQKRFRKFLDGKGISKHLLAIFEELKQDNPDEHILQNLWLFQFMHSVPRLIREYQKGNKYSDEYITLGNEQFVLTGFVAATLDVFNNHVSQLPISEPLYNYAYLQISTLKDEMSDDEMIDYLVEGWGLDVAA